MDVPSDFSRRMTSKEMRHRFRKRTRGFIEDEHPCAKGYGAAIATIWRWAILSEPTTEHDMQPQAPQDLRRASVHAPSSMMPSVALPKKNILGNGSETHELDRPATMPTACASVGFLECNDPVRTLAIRVPR